MAVNSTNALSTSFLLAGLTQLTTAGKMSSVADILSVVEPTITARLARSSFARGLSSSLSKLVEQAQALNSAANRLDQGSYDNAYEARAVTSTNSAAVTATAADRATFQSFQISVSQVATAQTNQGSYLDSDDATALAAGVHRFEITTNGTTTQFAVEVEAGDTNRDMLDKMALAINEAEIGIRAGVTGTVSGTSGLKLTSGETGTDSAFTIADTAGSAVATAGVATATIEAQNAIFTAIGQNDDVAQESQSNEIALANGDVTATLQQATTDTVTLTVGRDPVAIASAVSTLVDQLNGFNGFLTNSSAFLRVGAGAAISVAASRLENRLADIGITRDDDGRFTLDQETLQRAIEDDLEGVQEALDGANGLATTAAAQTKSIITSPLSDFARLGPPETGGDALTRGLFLSQIRSQLTAGLLRGLIVNAEA